MLHKAVNVHTELTDLRKCQCKYLFKLLTFLLLINFKFFHIHLFFFKIQIIELTKYACQKNSFLAFFEQPVDSSHSRAEIACRQSK